MWEFDDQHRRIAEHNLLPGDELMWVSYKDPEFGGRDVYKTLRKTPSGDITFLVEDYHDRSHVITVGTYYPAK